jgi:hypothetical protein
MMIRNPHGFKHFPCFWIYISKMAHLRNHLLLSLIFWLAAVAVATATSEGEAGAKLEKAREDLRISRASEVKVAAELDRLRRSETVSAEIIKDYETYLSRVQAMVDEKRKVLQEMEEAYARHAVLDISTGNSSRAYGTDGTDPDLPDEAEIDEVAALDREFHASLAAFDEMLLRELDEIRAKSDGRMRDLAEEAAAAAQRLRERGLDVETSQSETEAGPEGASGKGQSGKQGMGTEEGRESEGAVTEKGQGGSDAEATSRGDQKGSLGEAGEGNRSSRRMSNSYDDDIVARQLREAAEKETDPELKEKLWKEYEAYKRGTSQ